MPLFYPLVAVLLVLVAQPVAVAAAANATDAAAPASATPVVPPPPAASTGILRGSVRGSGQPIPRFMALKADRVNMRTGPGLRYPVQFVYRQAGFPLKVIGEFDAWREVVDHTGDKGWMHASTLSGKRMGWVLREEVLVYKAATRKSPPLAMAEDGALVELLACGVDWCRIAAGRLRGWVRKAVLWGVLAEEEF